MTRKSSRHYLFAVVITGIIGTSGSVIAAVPDVGNMLSHPHRSDELLVKFKEGLSLPQAEAMLAASGSSEVRAFRRPRQLKRASTDRWVRIKLGKNRTLQDMIDRLSRNPNVEVVEPNYIWSASAIPNDPRIADLWGIDNSGQTGGTADADIDGPEGWDIASGDPSAIVGVIDSGVAYTHPDLAANMWVNTGETPGNGIDDDGNGYVDDIYGYDFVNNDGDPIDDTGHGSHVAGTVGAVGNNGEGISGVAWNAQIMALKFLDANGTGSTQGAIDAILYGVEMGAKVLNNSWSGGIFSVALLDAIEVANAADVLFVAAAGNDGLNNDSIPSYPASYAAANVIAVAASDHNDQLASFSNFGASSVDLAAPGVSILSTVPYTSEQTLSVGGTTYRGNRIDLAASGSVNGVLADGGLCGTTGAWSGQIVLCERGGNLSFFTKVINVQNGGAVAAVIYNNVPGNFSGTLGIGNSSQIPAISLTQTDGQSLVANELGAASDLVSIYDPAALGYDYLDGTSMATPHVSGAAVVLRAAEPALSVDQVKARILGGVDAVPALSNVTLTGGRLNLANLVIQPPDADNDGVGDNIDNCIEQPNADQRDTDGDRTGNICDADFNSDLVVNLSDYSQFRGAFGQTTTGTEPFGLIDHADFNGDGTVNLSDYSIFRSLFGKAPGPSAFNQGL
jgi:subtilisin family serine protease